MSLAAISDSSVVYRSSASPAFSMSPRERADLIKHVQVTVDILFHESELESRVTLNLHDGLYVTVPCGEHEKVIIIAKETIESEEFLNRVTCFATPS